MIGTAVLLLLLSDPALDVHPSPVEGAVGAPDHRLTLALEPDWRSPWAAFGLTAACELPTVFFGPSCGHLYAGEDAHFLVTGGARVLDFLALAVLEKWGPGVGPLYAVVQPHFSRSLAAYPWAYPLDLALVAIWWATGLYDLIDSAFSAHRHNLKLELGRRVEAGDEGVVVSRF